MDDTLVELWVIMADRVSPQLCCIHPAQFTTMIQEAVRLLSPFRNETDEAVKNLEYVIERAPTDSYAFRQAGEILNIISWQKKYHPDWNAEPHQLRHFRSGRCTRTVAHALALMQTGADDEVLKLTDTILKTADPHSDDVRIARFIRAASYICNGDPDEGEKELEMLYAYSQK